MKNWEFAPLFMKMGSPGSHLLTNPEYAPDLSGISGVYSGKIRGKVDLLTKMEYIPRKAGKTGVEYVPPFCSFFP
jgi:hypothetical protein